MYQVMYKGLLVSCQSREALDNLAADETIIREPKKRKPKAGKLSQWDKARKVAEALGREDIGNIRSEIAKGRHKELL